jgi:hypothetical protein
MAAGVCCASLPRQHGCRRVLCCIPTSAWLQARAVLHSHVSMAAAAGACCAELVWCRAAGGAQPGAAYAIHRACHGVSGSWRGVTSMHQQQHCTTAATLKGLPRSTACDSSGLGTSTALWLTHPATGRVRPAGGPAWPSSTPDQAHAVLMACIQGACSTTSQPVTSHTLPSCISCSKLQSSRHHAASWSRWSTGQPGCHCESHCALLPAGLSPSSWSPSWWAPSLQRGGQQCTQGPACAAPCNKLLTMARKLQPQPCC